MFSGCVFVSKLSDLFVFFCMLFFLMLFFFNVIIIDSEEEVDTKKSARPTKTGSTRLSSQNNDLPPASKKNPPSSKKTPPCSKKTPPSSRILFSTPPSTKKIRLSGDTATPSSSKKKNATTLLDFFGSIPIQRTYRQEANLRSASSQNKLTGKGKKGNEDVKMEEFDEVAMAMTLQEKKSQQKVRNIIW